MSIHLGGDNTTARERDVFIITDELRDIFTVVNYVVLSGIISFAGVVLNVTNIIVFAKQGFKDTTNITLLALAVSDTMVLLTMVEYSVGYNPLIYRLYDGLEVRDLQHWYVGWGHVYFSRISAWLTVVITVERYVCIAFPLHVKTVITPKIVSAVVIVTYTVMIVSLLPVYITSGIDRQFDVSTNKTVLSTVYTRDEMVFVEASLDFNVFAQVSAFVTVSGATYCLVKAFLKLTAWRSENTGPSTTSLPYRDRRLVKMILSISVIFIISSVPGVCALVAMSAFKEYTITGLYKNLYVAGWTCFFLLESVSYMANFFVYLSMSSKYRVAFMSLFRFRNKSS